MVARIESVKSTADPLSYNEKKVAQHQAEFIHSKNFLLDKDSLTHADKLQRFQRLNELNSRSRVKMLHASLNFHPSENLSNERLSAIADRYMEGLKMENQPYLVYRHNDSRHPHVHIVSSFIQPDGHRIDTHRIGARLSEPTRKAIEQEFHLLPSKRRQRSPVPSPDDVRKITPGDATPVSESVDRIVSCTCHHYHFTNLPEYNAILRTFNVTAEMGRPGSKTHRHNGIYYVALDDQGNKISPPIMASQLPCKPTLTRLNDKFHHPDAAHLDQLASIRRSIDWALDQRPKSLHQLVSRLQGDGIEIVVPPGNGRNPHDQIYVDHRTHTAVAGETLGSAYTTTAINNTINSGQKPGRRRHSAAETPEGTHFNASVPQVLSAVLQTTPGRQGPDDFGRDQHLGPRHKH